MKSQSSTAHQSEQTNQTEQNPELGSPATEKPSLGIPTTSSALITLFNKAVEHLDTEELEHLAGFDEVARMDVENLASMLTDMGCFFYASDKVSTPSEDNVAKMFFSLSSQMDTIGGLLFVAGEAAYRLANQEVKDGAS